MSVISWMSSGFSRYLSATAPLALEMAMVIFPGSKVTSEPFRLMTFMVFLSFVSAARPYAPDGQCCFSRGPISRHILGCVNKYTTRTCVQQGGIGIFGRFAKFPPVYYLLPLCNPFLIIRRTDVTICPPKLNNHRLKLSALQGGPHRLFHFCKIRGQRCRFLFRVILTKRHKIIALAHHQRADIL